MKYLLTVLVFLFFILPIAAHNNEVLDKIETAYKTSQLNYEEALLQKFYAVFDKEKLNKEFAVTSHSPIKCVTHLIAEYRNNMDKLSDESKAIIDDLIVPPTKSKDNLITTSTYISPYQKFEITYTTTGDNAVSAQDLDNSGIPDYVEKVAQYFDRSWKVLIDTLGFHSIPLSPGEYYQISFEDMDYYGYTSFNNTSAGTEIVMHNSFSGFPTNTDPEGNALGAAKVTAVHEFKHAIQFVYNQWSEPGWFIEADATWSEDIGFDYVNDYYNYLGSSQILEPGRGLQQGDGYEDNLFFHYFSQKYSINTNKEIWTRRELYNESVFSSVANMLENYNATFDSAFTEYYTWLYNNGNRYNPILPGFQEAENYPTSIVCSNISTLPALDSGCDRAALSGNFLVYNSENQNQFLQLLIDAPSGNNVAAIVVVYKDSTASIKQYELSSSSSFDFFLQPKLTEIEKVIVIPVVTSISGANFDYAYSFDAFRTAIFTHTPFTDNENNNDIDFVVNLETPQNLAYTDSLKLFYQIDSSGYQNIVMTPTGNLNEYSATLLDPGYDINIDYYFKIADQLDENVYYPENAPDSVFSFYVGADTVLPIIEHNELSKTVKYNFPFYLYANISDNIGLDSCYLEYRLNDGEWLKEEMSYLGNNIYSYVFDYSADELIEGDYIDYRITTVDSSLNSNKKQLPETDYYRINITDGYYFSSTPNIPVAERQIFLIPDKDTISVGEDVLISDLNIYFESDHLRFSDYEIRLNSPDGTTYKLYNQNWVGTSLENAGSSEIVFDSDAFLNFDNALLLDTTLANGTFKPVEADLTELGGTSSEGDWVLSIVDKNVNSITGNLVEWGLIITPESTTDIEVVESLVKNYQLYQNYPNPFNPTTQIKFALPQASKVSVKVYDILGNEITTLVNQNLQSGIHEISFNGSNLSSGIYFVRMIAENFTSTKKIMLVK